MMLREGPAVSRAARQRARYRANRRRDVPEPGARLTLERKNTGFLALSRRRIRDGLTSGVGFQPAVCEMEGVVDPTFHNANRPLVVEGPTIRF
jgi:hypothetical protein